MFITATSLHARAKVADETKHAIVISLTIGGLHHFLSVASSEWITLDITFTEADCFVILGSAHSIVTTSTIHTARILTTLIDARHGERTSVIGSTSIDALAVFADLSRSTIEILHADGHERECADGIGIAGIARWTRASWTMIDRRAERVDATSIGIVAWILALFVHAGKTILAAIVESASNHASIIDAHLSLLAFAVFVALE